VWEAAGYPWSVPHARWKGARAQEPSRFARTVLINGSVGFVVGFVVASGRRLRIATACTVKGGKIAEMDVIADRLGSLNLGVLDRLPVFGRVCECWDCGHSNVANRSYRLYESFHTIWVVCPHTMQGE
jgi:hypothetical protein